MKPAGLSALLAVITILNACGGGTSTTTPPPPPPPPPQVNASIVVSNTTSGAFDLAMSTSFQPAEWDYQFFQRFPNDTTPLANLQPQHIRLQGISQGVPQGMAGSGSQAWDFTVLDSIVQPVLGVGDHSPEFQIAKAPPFMYVNDDSSQSFNDPGFAQFATYAANLVKYYDTGGFTDSSGTHISAAYPADTITWWGIYNEPSINNNLTAATYTSLYNALVPAMRAADPSIKFVAMELCCGSEDWVKTFVAGVTGGLPVDAVATHYYSSCNQSDTDAELFGTIPGFVSSIKTIRANLATNANFANVPIWITENNVNADFSDANGMSVCNPGQKFVTDKRGSSAFFAAWRPYVFSQVGQAGAAALYHWDFDADAQYGEINDSTGQPQLSYWVDYWLAKTFPTGAGAQVLSFTNSDRSEIEVLPVVNADNSVAILVSNHAVASPSDNNGTGVSAKVSLDLSALGTFTSASEVIIDATTDAVTGPSAVSMSPQSSVTINFNGYGVAFLTLK